MNPRLVIEQKITAFVNQYRIYLADEKGEKANLVAFAQQKRFSFKEIVIFYSDEQKTTEIFHFRAEKVVDVHGNYCVESSDGKLLGTFGKEFKKSLTNSTWNVFKDNKLSLTLTETSKAFAFFRRVLKVLSIFADLTEIIAMFLKYHFTVTDTVTGKAVGSYEKTARFKDHYVLSMTDEAYSVHDWRVLAALAVGLDVLQSR